MNWDNQPIMIRVNLRLITDEEEAQSVYTEGLPTLKAGALIMEKVNNRVFSRKNYLQAIPLDEIALNSNLKQNPNW